MRRKFLSVFHKNKKGMTLVEAIVAIAMVAVVSVGVTSLLFSLSKISRMSADTLKQNAVYRVIKENIVASARQGLDISGNTGKKVTGPGTHLTSLAVKDRSDQAYPEYRFDVVFSDSSQYGEPSKNVDRYKVSVKQRTGEYIADFYIEFYSETGG